ncbi:SRPBCC family protein [Saccharomonospora sp. NPDC046836]|uniref:SRPBCC family protein n=1 Tax=Saccharomonospora sp. NPDC046836 TaxID=3156921 RepID=UPI0033D2689F
MIDIINHLNSVSRRVGARTRDAREMRSVVISQTYAADSGDVWDACTNPERLRRWFSPVSGELRLGGRYQLEGSASGTIEQCDPPKHLAVTWEYDGGMSWVEVSLTPVGQGSTRFELEHTVPSDEHWAEFGPGAGGVGWDISLLRLATDLSGRHLEPEEKWAVTESGIEFMTVSSQRWGEAGIAAGADPAQAKAAADRTTAFYTGAPASD